MQFPLLWLEPVVDEARGVCRRTALLKTSWCFCSQLPFSSKEQSSLAKLVGRPTLSQSHTFGKAWVKVRCYCCRSQVAGFVPLMATGPSSWSWASQWSLREWTDTVHSKVFSSDRKRNLLSKFSNCRDLSCCFCSQKVADFDSTGLLGQIFMNGIPHDALSLIGGWIFISVSLQVCRKVLIRLAVRAPGVLPPLRGLHRPPGTFVPVLRSSLKAQSRNDVFPPSMAPSCNHNWHW